MSEIKTGDKVRIRKPKNNHCWNSEGHMDYLDGAVVTVPSSSDICSPYFMLGPWHIYFHWCEKVEEEMTLAQWEKMSPQERLEWNRPAFEALAEEGVEWLGKDGTWWPSESVDLSMPHRVVKHPVDPPKELWFVVDERGTIATVGFENQEAAEEAAEEYHENFGARVVKYVIAE